MYHLRLLKGKSYSNNVISATRSDPDVYTEDKATADRAVASGYFAIVEERATDTAEETAHLDKDQLYSMTLPDLKKLAADIGIDASNCKVKADYVEAIVAVEVTPGPGTETGGEIDYSEE